VNLGEMLDQDASFEEAAQLALDGARRTRELGMRDACLLLEGEAASRVFKLGRLDEADRLTRSALDLRPSLAKLAQCAARARVEIHRGGIGAAEPLLRAAEEAMPDAPATWIEPLASARVELELLCGRPGDALRLGERALELGAEEEYVAFTARLHALGARAGAVLAERARATGDESAADAAASGVQALVDRLGRALDRAGRRGSPPPEALAHRDACVAEAARADGKRAAPAWAALARRWAELGLPLEEAYARLRAAECLVLGGDRKRAEESLAAALAIARRCGAAWLREQLEGLARRARLSPGGDVPADGAPVGDAVERLRLTERERAVLELLAVGKTNREIGAQLFMAEKTASVHVSRILAKLDVSSRVEAATAAQRLGIVR